MKRSVAALIVCAGMLLASAAGAQEDENQLLSRRQLLSMEAPASPLSSRPKWRDLRFRGPFLEIFSAGAQEKTARPKVLVFYSLNVENDHVLFALDGLRFFAALAQKENFVLEATTNWEDLNDANVKKYQLVVWLNEFPHNQAEREAFEKYMTAGGAWLGFHVSAYNDKHTKWPWFMTFIGGGVFDANSWPPLPAQLIVDDPNSPVTRGLPEKFVSPTNEWYRWKPSPRADGQIHVLLTLDPANYPLGIKGLLTYGDIPVVWTNTNYKMVYMNMGHGDRIFTGPVQNTLVQNATEWLLGKLN